MLVPGTKLQGRYRVVHKLGEGGMGAVYEAIDERFGTPIALKEIVFEAADAKQRARLAAAFEREAKSLAKARHESIPFVRDYFSEESREYLVMELVEGDDLAGLLIKNQAPFPVDDAAGWLRQLLDALDYLHDLKPPIIHRDIKPQNLKVTSRKRLKLLDFGIAKSSDMDAVATRNQTFIGATLNYSPIEQILRVIDPTFREFIILKHEARAHAVLEQVTDARADIFAAGATFYHLVTNRVPEDATKRTLDLWEGKADPLLHPRDIISDLPRGFGDLLLKAMSVDRDDRFSSAQEMLDALDNVASTPARAVVKATDAATVPLINPSPVAVEPLSLRSEPLPEQIEINKMPAAVTEQMVDPPPFEPMPAAVTAQTDWGAIVRMSHSSDTRPNNLPEPEVRDVATVPERRPSEMQGRSSRRKLLWVAPAAIGGLAIAVLGGAALMFNGSGAAANTQNLARPPESVQPVVIAPASQTPAPDIYVAPTPVPTPMAADRQTDSTNTNSSAQAVTRPRRAAKPNSGRDALAPIWATPKKKKPAQQDLNCVYTDECKE